MAIICQVRDRKMLNGHVNAGGQRIHQQSKTEDLEAPWRVTGTSVHGRPKMMHWKTEKSVLEG